MTDLSDVRLPLAEQAFAVANTPLFLLRKLRSDPAVLEIARVAQPKAILSALKKSLRRKPKTLSDAVSPYVYLVALSMTRDLGWMEEAARTRCSLCRLVLVYRESGPRYLPTDLIRECADSEHANALRYNDRQ